MRLYLIWQRDYTSSGNETIPHRPMKLASYGIEAYFIQKRTYVH